MTEVISKVIPILLLISLGYFLRVKNILTDSSIHGIKRIVLNIALPSVLFITFIDMNFYKEHLFIFLINLLLLFVLYFLGEIFIRIKPISHPIMPFIIPGFASGLIGIPLYSSIFGMENLSKITILGVSNELFLWVILYTILGIRFNYAPFSLKVVLNFFKTPLIISIILGIALNLSGLSTYLINNSVLSGLKLTIQYSSLLATPLILIIVGFDLKFNAAHTRMCFKLLLIRMSTILFVGYLFKYFIFDKFVGNDVLFNYAYFTYLILPSPYSLPIILGESVNNHYKDLLTNLVVLNTVVCIVVYVAFVFMI